MGTLSADLDLHYFLLGLEFRKKNCMHSALIRSNTVAIKAVYLFACFDSSCTKVFSNVGAGVRKV